jgi:rod shape-determining protein MreD
MVSIYAVVPLLMVVAILQTTVAPRVVVLGVFADLPLLVVVSWSLLRGPREGMIWGFISGFMVDLLSGAPFGSATLALMAVGLLSGLSATTAIRGHLTLPLVAAPVATVLYNLILLLVVRFSGTAVPWLDSIYQIILPSALLNAALVLVVYGGMRWLHLRFGQEGLEL